MAITRLEVLRERLQMYYEAERKIVGGAVEYQISDRRLRRVDLASLRSMIKDLEDEIALLEGAGRVKQVIFLD